MEPVSLVFQDSQRLEGNYGAAGKAARTNRRWAMLRPRKSNGAYALGISHSTKGQREIKGKRAPRKQTTISVTTTAWHVCPGHSVVTSTAWSSLGDLRWLILTKMQHLKLWR